MSDHATQFKLVGFNACSWLGTIAGIQATKDYLQIACLIASLAVSGASIWWIRRQAASLEAKDKPKDSV